MTVEDFKEKVELPQLKWGFPQPTVVVESASAAPFRGLDEEQYYRRLYLMAGKKDVYVVNKSYPIDPEFLDYLSRILGIELPSFLVFDFPQQDDTLTTSIMSNCRLNGSRGSACDAIELYTASGYRLQFFEMSRDEVEFANWFGNATYSRDILSYHGVGTKTGFKDFCQTNNIPTPAGYICLGIDDLLNTISRLGPEIIIKASEGTGGKECGSNVCPDLSITADKNKQTALLLKSISMLKPAGFPVVAEKKLLLPEASLHFFITDTGQIIFEPAIFGQIAKSESYSGGFYPNNLSSALNASAIVLAKREIIPALVQMGATGFHCLDFLYDAPANQIFFTEDNTRPGALDIVDHFVKKVISANNLHSKYCWHHELLPLSEVGIKTGVTFGELAQVLGKLLIPGENFVLISCPDTLPFGFSLLLTGVCCGNNTSLIQAESVHQLAVDRLKAHYGH